MRPLTAELRPKGGKEGGCRAGEEHSKQRDQWHLEMGKPWPVWAPEPCWEVMEKHPRVSSNGAWDLAEKFGFYFKGL